MCVQMEYASGQRVNLWYNINPMHTSKHGDLGSKVSEIYRTYIVHVYIQTYIHVHNYV